MDENTDIAFCVVDMETTGLNANDEVPLEVGVALIDKEGIILAEDDWIVKEHTSYYEKRVIRAKKHPFVGPMHEKSGLWKDYDERQTARGREVVDDLLCEFLTKNGVRHGTVPMFGNSIGSLDRPFALVHFPNFNEALHYRNIDMSTLKELCKITSPTLYQNLLPIIGTKEDATHRVMDDIYACINEYQAYLENFLFTEED